jgi:molybdopterin converting factor small subunit
MVTVTISPPLRGPTGGEGEIQVAGETLRECIDAVDALHPGFGAHVLATDGAPHNFLKVFLNEDQMMDLSAAVADGDRIDVLAAVGGG